jgi:hypothetical protein
MGISYLIVTLALSNMQYGTVASPPALLNNGYVSQEVSEGLLAASGGNPWAIPVPEEGYSRDSLRRQSPEQRNQQRYITPEELKSLERVPEKEKFHRPGRRPLNTDGLFNGRAYSAPWYGSGGYDGSGYYGQDIYPSGGLYESPLYPGVNPLIDPYGYSPYWGSPYERILPFMY